MDALNIRIKVSEADEGGWTAELADGTGARVHGATRASAIAAAQAAALKALATKLEDGHASDYLGGVSFEIRSPRRRTLVNPESKPGSHRVLVVEDDEAIRNLMRRSLEGAGFRVLEAGSASEALALLEQGLASVDLLITDVILPGESGIELLHALESRHPNVHGMLVSGFVPDGHGRGQQFDPGTPFLSKPFTTEQLVAKVRSVLKTSPRIPPEPIETAAPRRKPRTQSPREDLARVLLAAPNPAEARFIGNYLESVGDHRVRVETASTARQVRHLTSRKNFDLVLIDHALAAEEPALVSDLAATIPVVAMQPASDQVAAGDGVVRRESAMLANLARAVSRLVGLPEPSEDARAARRHDYVDVVCHDLRNPASTIAGYTELLLERTRNVLSREQAGALERIRRNAYFMLDLIESILDTERLEAGVLHAKLTEVDLTALARDTIDDFRPAAESKVIGLIADLPDVPCPVHIDQKLFCRALANLISNALKFSPAESRIEVGLRREPARIALWVRDQGPGIPLAEQERLFTKFGRTSVVASRGEHQTGLGLFIVKRIMDLHGARIAVDSAPGRGSEFRVLMDLEHHGA